MTCRSIVARSQAVDEEQEVGRLPPRLLEHRSVAMLVSDR
jgi:hypothetical protein